MKPATRSIAIKSLKIAAAATLAILLAQELGLQSAATAGIITILSLQNTKRETLRSAKNRVLAFLCALLIAGACFFALGFTVWAFALYLFLFALLCLAMGWGEAIAMDSVLISHFLAQGTMAVPLLVNEGALLLIGAGLGVLTNLHLHPSRSSYDQLALAVDTQIKKLLHCLAARLSAERCTAPCARCMEQLNDALRAAKECAVTNAGNTLLRRDSAELDYILMRQAQSVVLSEILESVQRLRSFPAQADVVAALFAQIEAGFHRDNTVETLLAEQARVLAQLQAHPLPQTRPEFEARAILYHVLLQSGTLLEIKRSYIARRGADLPASKG